MSSASSPTSATHGKESTRLGQPVLTTADAIAQSLAIGPVFSAAFVAFLIAGAAGGVAPLATLIGAVGTLAVAWIITLYARRYNGAGAIYDYLRRATTPALGLCGAGIYFLGTIFLGGAGIYLVIGAFVSSTLNAHLGWNVPWWLGGLIVAALIFILNHVGVRITTRVQLTLSVLSVTPVVILALAILAKGGVAGNTLQAFNPATSNASAIFHGVLFAITLFIGFEASASLGEETADPRRSIPRAVFGSVLISAVFYLLVVYAADIGYGLAHTDKWAADPAPLDTLATKYVGGWLATIIDFAIAFDMLAVASAFTATSARGWFALARHGLLPSPLACMSRYRTPIGGNILVLTSAVLFIVATLVLKVDALTAFGIVSTTGSIMIEVIYVALASAAAGILLRERSPWWSWPVLIVAVVIPILALYGTVAPFPTWPTSLGVYLAIAGAVVAIVWTLVAQRAYPRRLAEAAQPHAWETEVAL